MMHTQLRKRLERLEQSLQPSQGVIRAVILIDEDEPDSPHEPGVRVIHVTLGTSSEQAEEAR